MAISVTAFRKIALSFPETIELAHFEKPAFRIGKKIFATVDLKKKQACLKLNPAEQDLLSIFDKTIVFPVPNKWGKQGWTYIKLDKVHKEVAIDALITAYCEVAPKKLAAIAKSNKIV